MYIAVYKCMGCGKMHYDKSNMRRHVHVVCRDACLDKLSGVVVVDAASSTITTSPSSLENHIMPPRAKPGPKPVDVAAAWRGRIPAFEGGDDERIDAVFATDLVDALLDVHVDDIPVLLYDALWSARAPEPFQSLIMYRNAIHEIETLDDETGDISYVSRGTLTKRFVRDMAVYTLELAYAIAKDSIPSRCPDKAPRAMALLQRLREDSLRDALKTNAKGPRETRALAKLRDAMAAHFPTCFSR